MAKKRLIRVCVFTQCSNLMSPLQWGWPPDLLIFALVTALCQYSVHHSGTHQHPRTVHRPVWSAWTKFKQITFLAVTDLQPSDKTARQRTTTTRHNRDDSSLPFIPKLWFGEVVTKAFWFHRAGARRGQPANCHFIHLAIWVIVLMLSCDQHWG